MTEKKPGENENREFIIESVELKNQIKGAKTVGKPMDADEALEWLEQFKKV